MFSNILFVVVTGSSQDASGMSRTYRRPPVRCHVCHRWLHSSTNTIKWTQTPQYQWQLGMMQWFAQCCFPQSQKLQLFILHFLGTRHYASTKKQVDFGRGLWKMHVCANNCKPAMQRLVTCSRAWHARENKAACKEKPANRPSLNLTSWCAARHLLRFFSIPVALTGVWLVCVKWRCDCKHIYCNSLACSPSSLLWLVQCGLTGMELQREAHCRNLRYFCHFRIIITNNVIKTMKEHKWM